MDLKNQPNCSIKVEYVGDIVKPKETENFIKRLIGVVITEEVNGTSYTRRMTLQATGNTDKPQYDKTKILDGYMPGEVVDIKYSIRGSVKKNDKLPVTAQNPEQIEGFNNLELTEISRVLPMVQQPQYSGYPHMPGYQQPQPMPGYQPTANYVPPQPNPAAPAPAPAPTRIPRPAGPTPKDAQGNDMVWNEFTGAWEEMPF